MTNDKLRLTRLGTVDANLSFVILSSVITELQARVVTLNLQITAHSYGATIRC
jgi:hypothetical protein